MSAVPSSEPSTVRSGERLTALLAAQPSSSELREEVLIEILIDQMKVIEAMNQVTQLQVETDTRLTATVQALRDASAQFGKLIEMSRAAFIGEVATRAADQARRAAVEAVSDELAKLRHAVEVRTRERHSGADPRRTDSVLAVTRPLVFSVSVGVLVGVAVSIIWIARHVMGS
ncbi:hypothetical protein [Burkholderia alba]|uniref:hypothetical protein n=1 Tax=Burkholderia alba TaxID=2683677 RepID=UPI002B058067|nr:hypothetical protein [Burkholderia alba]